MKSFIPETRPVIGDDLSTLRERLGQSVGEACWLYGISMTKWMNLVNKEGKLPVTNATLALMVRALSARLDACPLPVAPSAEEVQSMIKQVVEGLDLKRLAVMFGCEGSSGYRWITMQGEVSPVTERLFLVFRTLFAPALAKGPVEAAKFLVEWDRMVEHEAQQRGIADIFSTGRWTPKKQKDGSEVDTTGLKPVRGEDLDVLRERLGLGTSDACWLFGMSMTRWMTVAKKDWDKKFPNDPEKRGGAKLPLRNTSLALLVRILTKYPDACPIPTQVTAQEVFDALRETESDFGLKRLAIMFGCEASSGYRWITQGSKISPALERTFKVFMTLFMPQVQTSKAKALAFLADWDNMVNAEAKARGIDNVFTVGRWTEPEKTAQKLSEKKEKAEQAKLARAEAKAAKKAQEKADKKAEKLAAKQAAAAEAAKSGKKLISRAAKKSTDLATA